MVGNLRITLKQLFQRCHGSVSLARRRLNGDYQVSAPDSNVYVMRESIMAFDLMKQIS